MPFSSQPFPAILAPLAGVSDYPFRRVCREAGADLTYVEMISATALLYQSRRTLEMLACPADEALGVQITAKTAVEMGQAVALLDKYAFTTIDINMGCPVKKVVKTGCGSAILRDVGRVYETTKAACENTSKPVSVKIRLGWDRQSLNYLEVGRAVEDAGAAWLTVHGRARSDDYSQEVDIAKIAELKRALSIPVIGNGNVFSSADSEQMRLAGLDGVMVSRGALGNPWVFSAIKGRGDVSVDGWHDVVQKHIDYQESFYGQVASAGICLRKHMLWYLKGWPGAKRIREQINALERIDDIRKQIEVFAGMLVKGGETLRAPVAPALSQWDPKFDLNRVYDQGVGDDDLDLVSCVN